MSDLARRTLPLMGIGCCYLMTKPSFSTFHVRNELQIIALVCCEWEEAGAPQEGAHIQGAEQECRGTQEIPLPLGVSELMLSTSQMLCKVHRQAGTRPKLLMQSTSLSYFEFVSDRSLDMANIFSKCRL